MLRNALRNMRARKARMVTTGLAVTIGVAFMAGTLALGDTITKTFDQMFADVYENTDAVVRSKAAFEDPSGFGEQRPRFDQALIDDVRGVDGVAIAQGDVFGYAQLVDKKGEPVGNPDFGPPTIGGNWYESKELNSFTLYSGRGPESAGEVVVDKNAADEAGYRVGDRAKVLVKGPPLAVTIVGIVKFGQADSPGGASFVLFTTEEAQRVVAEPGKFDTISVAADKGVTQDEIVSRIQARLPDTVEVVTGAAVVEENQDAFQQGFSVFNQFMLIFAVVALFVGGFMIFNSFFITVAQRTRENALMRAVGASKRQVLFSVLLEAALIGVVASAIGLAAGVAVAGGLKGLLSAFGFAIPAGGVVFSLDTAIIALVAGIGVTMLAAISPARKAGKVPPVAAMRDVAVGSTGYGSKERIMVGLATLVLAVLALMYGLFGRADNALPLVGLAVLLVFFGVSILGRTVALPLSRFIGAPLPRLRGITGNLARENAMRNPKRTAATASALMIGVGLVGFITIFAASTKASFSDTIDKAFTGDFIVTANGGYGTGGVDPELAGRIRALPEIDRSGPIRAAPMSIDGKVDFVIAAGDDAFELIDVEPIVGRPGALDADSIGIHEDVAKSKGWKIGDKVPVVFRDSGAKELTIAMVYAENQPAGDYVIDLDAHEANFQDRFDLQIFVGRAAGVSADDAFAAVQRVAAGYPGTKVLDQTEYKEEQTAFVDQMLGLVYALLALAIVIALMGIGNTLALSILERTRELGVLRAVGMTRGQLRSAIRWESVIVALQGTSLGLVIGIFFGWALVRALESEGIGTFVLPFGQLAVVVVLAALAGVVAALLPARRAARLDVLRAVVTE